MLNLNFMITGGDIKQPCKGKLLIAEPFLSDPNFSRSVVLLCEHETSGTVGFVLNQPTDMSLSDVAAELEPYMPVLAISQGGPVEADTLHIIHRLPEVLGGVEVADGIYWGGSYSQLQQLVMANDYNEKDIRLFIGYAGWAPGQLATEMTEGTWLTADCSAELVFECEPHLVWKRAISMLGKNYTFLANLPLDPRLN